MQICSSMIDDHVTVIHRAYQIVFVGNLVFACKYQHRLTILKSLPQIGATIVDVFDFNRWCIDAFIGPQNRNRDGSHFTIPEVLGCLINLAIENQVT
jgi:hypothetical protein